MATFEGPLLAIKSVSALAHYTDWIIGHAHGGALGWNGLMAAGLFYWLAPRLWDKPLYSKKAADAHFYIATIGIVLYLVSMWVSGINQGLMWRALNPDGSLTYPSFTETLLAIRPMYMVRALGGTMYLAGFILMIWNLAKTIIPARATTVAVDVVIETEEPKEAGSIIAVVTGRPLWFSVLGVALLAPFFVVDNAIIAVGFAVLVLVVSEVGYVLNKRARAEGGLSWFGIIEHRPMAFTVLTLVSILIGGVAELLPTILVEQAVPATGPKQKPYTALEQQGRDVYTREGCYVCHSQMIRPMVAEYLRYGEASRAEEFIYDHPFQWGSKRTGPDLHRIGGKYPTLWHYTHLMDPRSTSPGSNMPSYAWLSEWTYDDKLAPRKLALMQKLGVPYTNDDIDHAEDNQKRQANTIVADLATQGVTVKWNNDIVALMAYLQRLGRDKGIALSEDAVQTTSVGAPVIGGER
jgi:cytochrome c oxidase cbb3-type subunit I/II